MSEKDHDFGSLVCVYAQILPKIRKVAKDAGYAIAIHGSMERDFDLVAIPWIRGARQPKELVRSVAEIVHGYVIGNVTACGIVDHLDNPTTQPHGRLSWNIYWGGKPMIDLSVMPLGDNN